MATFKVGQRVRIVAKARRPSREYPHLENAETIITSGLLQHWLGPYYKTAATDAIPVIGIFADCLEPLTDPKADAFIEKIRQLKPLPVQEIA